MIKGKRSVRSQKEEERSNFNCKVASFLFYKRDDLMNKYKLYNGDCLEVMDKLIEEGVKVDCILTDVPYGTTACSWDTVIPFDKLWEHYNRIIKDNGAIVLFGSEPFSSKLRCSNLEMYRYDWVWKKTKT